MTAEQKRERLLKRALPGLAITVIYFVFISGFISDKMDKAEKTYSSMSAKRISRNSLSDALKQSGQIQGQISALKLKQRNFKDQLKNLAGFLSTDTPSNSSSEKLAEIMGNNRIRIVEEVPEELPEEQLNASLREVWRWLKPAETTQNQVEAGNKAASKATADGDIKASSIQTQHLWLRGQYSDMYRAMATLAESELQAVPVQLTMRTPEEDTLNGELEWELILWM